METTKKIWFNGELVDWVQAKTHVLTHSLHYGGGVFEGIRFYDTKNGPAVFRLNEHINRLFYSADCLKIKIPFSPEEIIAACRATIAENETKAGYIRPIVYYGYKELGVDPQDNPVEVVIAVWPWGTYLSEDPIKVKTSSYIRIHPRTSHADAKICGHYANSILACQEAHHAGYDEALFLDFEDHVAEGPGENIFMVKDLQLYTPPLGNILAGITRLSIITLAKKLGFKVHEKKLKLEDFKTADEVFFTGTAAEVTPIGQIDDDKIKQPFGPVTRKLKEEFLKIVRGENDDYAHWLTPVKEPAPAEPKSA